MITKVDPYCHLQEVMQQMSKKTRQIRTYTKEVPITEALAEIITETEAHLEESSQEGTTSAGTIETIKETLDHCLAEYARRPHIQTYLDIQISHNTYLASLPALVASLKKYANSA